MKKYGYAEHGYKQGDTKTEVQDDETYVGLPSEKPTTKDVKHETYIGKLTTEDKMNKIIKTRVGDEIHYYLNGVDNYGVVAKMSSSYVTIFKEDGKFYEVPIDDTFFVKDILVNKRWNDMTPPERTEILQEAKVLSPRFLTKQWEQLPKELQEVIVKNSKNVNITKAARSQVQNWSKMDKGVRAEYAQKLGLTTTSDWKDLSKNDQTILQKNGVWGSSKATGTASNAHFGDVGSGKTGGTVAEHVHGKRKSDLEQGGYGNVGGTSYAPIATGTPIKADDDYEGQTKERKEQDKVEFQHEEKQPQTDADKKQSTKGEEPRMRGEFTYTEATKYRTKGIQNTPETRWGMRQVIIKADDVDYDTQTSKHKEWHESPREGRASSNFTPIGSPEFLEVDEDTGRCNMCGQEFTGRSKKKLEPKDAAEVTKVLPAVAAGAKLGARVLGSAVRGNLGGDSEEEEEVTKFDTDNKNLKQLRANQPKGDSTTGNVVEDDDDELSNQPDYKDDRD